jgi:N-acetylneuraminic acid mutarotase
MVALAGMLLLGTAPAQAATAGHPNKPAAAKTTATTPQAAKAAQEDKDTRAVCQAAQKGYATCMSLLRTNVKTRKGMNPDLTPSGYGPSDLQSAYDLPSATSGSGQTVAIVDAFDDPNAEADLQVYRAQYGLPVCDTANGCFQKVNQDGQASPLPPAAGSNGWDVEESLDIDMVSAVCPNCHIDLVEANSNDDTDLDTAEDTAVAMGAKFVSNSWGGPEYDGETSDDAYFNHPGVVITAASGDYGYDNYLLGDDSPNYPAASGDVTSVGGTTLTQDSGSPRGWTESAWSGSGSGCSQYEAKPTWQTDTGCSDRTENDVSAVADPSTGVALYDSYSAGGWTEVGGTSVATPIIASTYALAGTPVAGSNPASYPYQNTSSLNDVTSGSNGSCTPAYWCNAGPGYDGPTGLGTPDGVTAFQGAPSGVLSGTVTSASGAPLSGATVSAGSGYTATTGSSGDYTMTIPTGSYDVTAEAFGYKSQTVDGVQVSRGQTATENLKLTAVPSSTLSGTVTDGSGHAWPLYASIAVNGYPGGAVYTNPYTGAYSISLPRGSTYTLTVTPVYPGYNAATATEKIGAASKTKNIKVTVDSDTCTAPGYAYKYAGASEGFTGWSGTTAQDGWTNVDNEGNGDVWMFGNDPDGDSEGQGPPAGSSGDYAVVDSSYYGWGNKQDTSLVSPVVNLSKQTAPEISFDTWYQLWPSGQTADVDLSLDGGQTWSTVWEQTTSTVDGPVAIPIPQAAGHSDVRVRFHYTTSGYGWWWALDNVFVGTQTCAVQPGGLVDGVVTDANTGAAVNGAAVANDTTTGQSGVSAASPNDPSLTAGFYWMFASPAGSDQFTASQGSYTPATQTVNVADNTVTHQDWSLKAGDLAVTPGSVSISQTLGGTQTKKVTFSDNGTAPVQVQLTDEGSGFTPMDAKPGAKTAATPRELVKGHYSPDALVTDKQKVKGGTISGTWSHASAPADSPWTAIADYPEPIMDNAVGYDAATGNVYSVAGTNGTANVADGYVYTAASQQWTAITPLPQPLEAPGGAFLNGNMYVVGGWDTDGNATSTLYAYNPSTTAWTQEANLPEDASGLATAVLDGQLYVVGGCTTGACSPTSDAVYRYNPLTNTWTQLADYPTAAAFLGCAGTDSEIICAGGDDADSGQTLTSTYIYDPSANTWSQGADMPYDDWGMIASGSGNMFQIADGVTADSTEATNQVSQYDPASNSWSALPNANNAEGRGGGACGMYQIGGSTGGFSPQTFAEVLPGYNQCGVTTIPWLATSASTFTLNPGQSTTVALTMDSSTVSQPGAYTAQLAVNTNSPYQFQPVNVSMQVNPPSSWSKIAGTVTGASTGDPLSGATVQICAQYIKSSGTCGSVTYTLTTDSSGNYQLWLNRGDNPLEVIVADVGYEPVSKVVKLTQGVTTSANFALTKTS